MVAALVVVYKIRSKKSTGRAGKLPASYCSRAVLFEEWHKNVLSAIAAPIAAIEILSIARENYITRSGVAFFEINLLFWLLITSIKKGNSRIVNCFDFDWIPFLESPDSA